MKQHSHALWLLVVAALLFGVSPRSFGQAGSLEEGEWARETIMFPPAFAPELPTGVEELRFPRGWRDPESQNFWSYAILMRLDEPALSDERIAEVTELYYTGLMAALGVGRQPDAPTNTVEVQLERIADGRYHGCMHLIDGFATSEPITVNLRIKMWSHTDRASTVEVRVSPQPDEHHIWADLQSAIEAMLSEQRIQHLARLSGGEWRTDIANGRHQSDTWEWGPARKSLTSVTTNNEGTGESVFGSFRLIYEHPRRKRLEVLALSRPGLIHLGHVSSVDQSHARFDMTLSYDLEEIEWAVAPTRRISSVWTFHSPSRYTNSWVEDDGVRVEPGFVAWRYARQDEVTPLPASAGDPPEDVRNLRAFLPLLASEWRTDTTRTTFEWIPYNEAILMRTTDAHTGERLAESVFYPHPHTKVVHAVAVHRSGAIDEGTATTDGDAIVVTFTRSDHASATEFEQRIELGSDGLLRFRTWSSDGAERTRLDETIHRPAGR